MIRILEVGIGLALVFTLVALICSILNEWLSAMLEKRGNLLWEGIGNLVESTLNDDLCNHQLMQGLVRKPTWFDKILKKVFRKTGRARPSYVPTETFVAALLDIVGSRAATGNPNQIGHLPTTFEELQVTVQNAEGIPDGVKQALSALVNKAGGDFETAKKNIGDWFDAGMDRVTGWYKRWTQLVVMVLSLIVAFILGVDCIAIAKRLWTDSLLRQEVVEAAGEFVEENQENPRLRLQTVPVSDSAPAGDALTSDVLTSDALTSEPLASDVPAPEAVPAASTTPAEDLARQKIEEIQIFQSQLAELSLPLSPPNLLAQEYQKDHEGAELKGIQGKLQMFGWWIGQHLLGFILTGLAASLGAPFWFDVLNKFVNLRSTGRKPDQPANVPKPATAA
jgi:hypothetical protein